MPASAPAGPLRLSDLARAAGVSAATASRALAGTGRVSPATRERVRETARRLGYTPSAAGRSLRTRTTMTIGLIVPDVSSAFYANAVKGAQHRLAAAGYQLLLMDTDEEPERELAAVASFLAGRVDGIILCSSGARREDLARLLVRRRVPVVFFDNVVAGLGEGRVSLANEAGIRELVGHLVDVHGHRRIGYVGGILAETGGEERLEGYRLGMLGHGLAIDPALVRHGDWTFASGQLETRRLLELEAPPTAIVYADADMVVGGLDVLRRSGVAVPSGMAIVAFDDPPTGPFLDPPLTTLVRRDREIGDIAASMVLRALEHVPGAVVDIRIPLELLVRRSCGCQRDEIAASAGEVPEGAEAAEAADVAGVAGAAVP